MKKTSIAIAAIAVGLIATGCSAPGDSDGDTQKLVVAGWGGSYDEATQEFYVDPFTEETGIEVELVPVAGTHSALIEAQQSSGNIEWDLIDSATASDSFRLDSLGYLEHFPAETKSALAEILPEGAMSDFGITMGNNGLVIACNTDVVDACPGNMTEFFDTGAFPGDRMLPAVNPLGTITAVMGTLVDKSEVSTTEPDLDTVFAKLAEIRPSVKVFFESGEQSRQAIRSGEVGIALMWSGAAYQVKAEDAPIEIHWDGGIYEAGYWLVQKGSDNAEAGFEFIQWIAEHPEQQAKWATALGGYGVPNPAAIEFLDEVTAEVITDNPKNYDLLLHQNWEWYVADDNAELADTLYQEYLLSNG